jgi:hypothetical protein
MISIKGGKTLRTPEFEKKKKKQRHLKIGLVVVLITMSLGLFLYGLRHERILIAEVSVEGAEVVSVEELEEVIWSALRGNYFLIVPRKNFLFYPRQSIALRLLDEVPRLSRVETNLDTARRLEVRVSERVPFALYCENVKELTAPKGCYFLDEEGFIFAEAPLFSGAVYFIYSLEEPLDGPVGRHIMEEEEFRELGEFISSFNELGIKTRLYRGGKDDRVLVMPGSGEIIWRTRDGFKTPFDNLVAFLSTDAIKAERNFIERVRYIDLRFSNKVFYRF